MTEIEALMSVVQLGESVERKKGEDEAPLEETMRIVRLGLAWALARVGEPVEAKRHADPALAKLQQGDALRRCVGRLFEERLREAELGDDAGRWPEVFTVELDRLADPFDRYKAELLLEHSLVLSPWVAIDPANRYWHHERGDPLKPPVERAVPSLTSAAELEGAFNAHPKQIPDSAFWRSTLRSAAPLGLPAVLTAYERLKAVWPHVRDPLTANSHFSVRVIGYLHTLLFAIAETVHPVRSS